MNYSDPSTLSTQGAAAGAMLYWWLIIGLSVLSLVGMWKMYVKAGHPGWAALIPFYNFYVMLKIAQLPGWWLILMFIPLVNIYVMVRTYHRLSTSFGHGTGFTLGLIFLPMIFFLILGFGSDQYRPAMAEGAAE